MQLLDGRLLLAPTDLNEFLLCRHLVGLNLAAVRGEVKPPDAADPHAELIARKGGEHERRHLAGLRAQGLEIVEIAQPRQEITAIEAAAAATHDAMRRGSPIIYQGVLFDGEQVGYADFLHRIERPSALGGWSYEVEDAKLAHRTKAYFLLQLCAYSEHVARLQGEQPARVHVVLGTKDRESFRLADYAAYYRRVKARFAEYVGNGASGETYPDPVQHCAVCRWAPVCDERRLRDDHPSLVANITRQQTARLKAAGITTLAALARADPARLDADISGATLARLVQQARLQLHHRETGEHDYELLEPMPDRGVALLPAPSSGDLFLDLEGDPLVEGGLEYLFGVGWEEGGEWQFQPFWAHSPDEERAAFERVIDLIMDRLERDPAMHVYHYAQYEPAAFKRLAGRYGTREDELDRLLRGKVFADLYTVVRQAIRLSQPSYSLKKVEAFYRTEARADGVTDGNESIVAYERWLESRDAALLRDIERYNADDVRSTCELRAWLVARRAEAIARFGRHIPWRRPSDGDPSEKLAAERTASVALAERLGPGLMALLLDYHQREARPAYWAYFDRCAKEPEELVDDPDSIGDLTEVKEGKRGPGVVRLAFPPQEHKMKVGTTPIDPATQKPAGTIHRLDDDAGWLELKRASGAPLPRALVPPRPLDTKAQRNALARLGEAVAGGSDSYRAAREVLAGAPPRMRGTTLEEIARRLDESHLFVQGPPGSGKTYRGARVIVDLLAQGKKVGIAALSHKAINHLLHEVEEAAVEAKVGFVGLKKATPGNPESYFESKLERPFITSSDKGRDFPPARVQLVAGTSWLFAKQAMANVLDHLVIDEAGQMSLADALAMGTSARNLILLGDPQQLPQVSQGAHPEGSGRSVLEHLLGEHDTVPADRGRFLNETWRMHPDVCGFISELCYEGLLDSEPRCARQRVDAPGELTGTGIWFLPVPHEGNSQSSREEAGRIAAAIGPLLEGEVVDFDGKRRRLEPADIMVVSPYNAQVRRLRAHLPAAVRVGTVDKFQGQEAMVVFFSMATSSGDDLPRRLEFLFSRNRLNVAISRARCLAVLVASPRLLDVHCGTVEEMRMVNGLCRFVEMAQPAGPARRYR
jgi:predicted RecB family nuclease